MFCTLEIPDEGKIERTQRGASHSLQSTQKQKLFKRGGKSTGGSRNAEEEQRRDQDTFPAVTIRNNSENRGEYDTGQGVEGDQKPDLIVGNRKCPGYRVHGRCYTAHPHHRFQSTPENDIQTSLVQQRGLFYSTQKK